MCESVTLLFNNILMLLSAADGAEAFELAVRILAEPKSVTLMCISLLSKIFSGLRSL